MKKSFKYISFCILLISVTGKLNAATLTYSGGSWSPNPPSSSTSGDDAVISSGTATFSDGWKMNSLTINPGAGVTYTGSTSVDIITNLDIQGSAHLTISGTGTIALGGNLTIADKAALAITGNGNVAVSGTSSVSITGYNSANGYNSWSAMFSGLGIESTMGNPNPCDIYAYDSQQQDWKYDYTVGYSPQCNGNSVTFTSSDLITDGTPDGNFDVGKGYFIPGSSSATRTFTASGAPINGTKSIQINGTSLSRIGGNDWNLIGNPYPSGLSIDAFLADNDSLVVGTSVYIFNNSTGDYNSTPYTNGDGEVLAAGQSFMIDPNTTNDGNLGNAIFKNSYRLTDNSTFRSNAFSQAFIAISNNNGLSDEVRVMFDMNCNNGIDHIRDARKMHRANGLNIGTYIDSSVYAINGVLPLEVNESITMNLFVTIPQSGSFEVSLDSIQNVQNHSWVVKDKLTGFSHDLNNSPFTISVNSAEEFTNRYQLIITNEDWNTSVNNIENQWFSCQCVNNNLFVDGLGNQLESVSVVDLSGRTVIQKKVNNSTINISTNDIPTGIYLVTVKGNNGKVKTIKTVVQ